MREEGDLFIDSTSMDVQPIVDAVHDLGSLERPTRDDKGRLHIASVDPLTCYNWAKESGTQLYSKEWRAYAKTQLASGNFSKFVIDRPKRYV